SRPQALILKSYLDPFRFEPKKFLQPEQAGLDAALSLQTYQLQIEPKARG
ncbi:MAG: hypothetical protein ACI9W2_001832, partial [Gammaproteobacteria bacterium]